MLPNRPMRVAFALALVGCVAAPISEVTSNTDEPQKLVTTSFTGGAACLGVRS